VPGLAGRVIGFCRSSPRQTRGRGRPRPAHRVHGTGPTKGWCAVASRRMAPRGSSRTVFREGLVSWARGHSPHQPRCTTTGAAAVVPRPPNLSIRLRHPVSIFYLTGDEPTKPRTHQAAPHTTRLGSPRRSSNQIIGGLPGRQRVSTKIAGELDSTETVRVVQRRSSNEIVGLHRQLITACCSP
jgi:hypothetical protein